MSKLRTGQLTISASAQQITSAPLETNQYRLRARATNVDAVYLGNSAVTAATGTALEPGQELVYDFNTESGENVFDAPITDWYAIGTAGDKLTWLAHLVSS